MYIIKSGQIRIEADGNLIKVLNEGESFGE